MATDRTHSTARKRRAVPRLRAKRRRAPAGALRWLVPLLVLPLALVLAKSLPGTASETLVRLTSLEHLPAEARIHAAHVAFLPLAAVIVVFLRVTLGIRVLGPFRSILLAVAFQVTGIALGITFFTLVAASIVALAPLIRAARLPYFGRVSVMLGSVAGVVVATVVSSRWFGVELLSRVAYFPIVALCLAADGFARTLRKEGMASALWRGSWTAAAAVGIAALEMFPGLHMFLLRHPEMVLFEIGMVMVLSWYFGHRLFAWINPGPAKGAST